MSDEVTGATEENEVKESEPAKADAAQDLAVKSLYAFKVGMSSVYDENGANIPVTVLRYEPWIVSQIKSEEQDGYNALQLACRPKKASRTSAAQKGHLASSGFENGAYFMTESREAVPEDAKVGQKVSISSLAPGEKVQITAVSKGRGFSGVIKRHGFSGGPSSHGSGFHRRPGSIGNCEFPGRVMAGRKMPGQYGAKKTTVKNLKIVEVRPDDNLILVKGAVPGSKNNLVKIAKA